MLLLGFCVLVLILQSSIDLMFCLPILPPSLFLMTTATPVVGTIKEMRLSPFGDSAQKQPRNRNCFLMRKVSHLWKISFGDWRGVLIVARSN